MLIYLYTYVYAHIPTCQIYVNDCLQMFVCAGDYPFLESL